MATATFEEIDFDDEPEENYTKNKPDDLAGVLAGVVGWGNIKLIVFVFLIFIFINTDMFIDKVLGTMFSDAVDTGRTPNTKGTMIQSLVLVLLYICADILIKYHII
jgi:hypothetical protein